MSREARGLSSFSPAFFSWRQFSGRLNPQGGSMSDDIALRTTEPWKMETIPQRRSFYIQLQRQKITQRGFGMWYCGFFLFHFLLLHGSLGGKWCTCCNKAAQFPSGGLWGTDQENKHILNPETYSQFLLRGRNSPRPLVLIFFLTKYFVFILTFYFKTISG